jgi:hypothetical protein
MGYVLGFAHTYYRHRIKELCADNTKNLELCKIIYRWY